MGGKRKTLQETDEDTHGQKGQKTSHRSQKQSTGNPKEVHTLPEVPAPPRASVRAPTPPYSTGFDYSTYLNKCLEEERANYRIALARKNYCMKEVQRLEKELAHSRAIYEQLKEQRIKELMDEYILAQFHVVNQDDRTFQEDMVYSIRALGVLRMRWDQMPGRKGTFVQYLQDQFGHSLYECNIPDFQVQGIPPCPFEEDVIRQHSDQVAEPMDPDAKFAVNLKSEVDKDDEGYDANMKVVKIEKEEREAEPKEAKGRNMAAAAGVGNIMAPAGNLFPGSYKVGNDNPPDTTMEETVGAAVKVRPADSLKTGSWETVKPLAALATAKSSKRNPEDKKKQASGTSTPKTEQYEEVMTPTRIKQERK